jgi:hypothetical protein
MKPSPDTLIVCVGVSASSVTTILPVLVPVSDGVKITPKVQVPFAATCVPLHMSSTVVKSPEGTTLVTLREILLGLDKVIVWAALGTSTGCWPKLRCVGEKVGFTRKPVPERLTLCGLLEAASEIVNDPVRVPVAPGVNTTATTQSPLGARSVPLHPSLDRLKSPEGTTLLICSEEVFGLVRVTSLAAEVVPTSCFAKVSEVGSMVKLVPVACAVAPPIAATIKIAVSAIAANLTAPAAACLMPERFECQ